MPLGAAGSGQWQRGDGTPTPGHPGQPCSCPTWTRLTVCRCCASLPTASSSWKTVSITWGQAGQAGSRWLLAPVAGSHTQTSRTGVSRTTREPSTVQLHCHLSPSPLPCHVLCPHPPDDALEWQLGPGAMGGPQQQGHTVAKGKQGQLGSCQLQDLLLVGETAPAERGWCGTASMARHGMAWLGHHGAGGPAQRALAWIGQHSTGSPVWMARCRCTACRAWVAWHGMGGTAWHGGTQHTGESTAGAVGHRQHIPAQRPPPSSQEERGKG